MEKKSGKGKVVTNEVIKKIVFDGPEQTVE